MCVHVCLDWPLTKNFKWACLNFNITKIKLVHSVGDREGLLPECIVSYLELSWSTHGNLLLDCYRSSTAGCTQAVQILIMTVVESSHFRTVTAMAKRQKFNSCYDFGVKFSLSMCNCCSCPDCWHTYVIPGYLWWRLINISTGEDLSTYLLVSVTNPALYNDKLVNQCAARSSSPHDDKIITVVKTMDSEIA